MKEIDELIDIIHHLREHCPWDKEQTLGSMKDDGAKEGRELEEAIASGDKEHIREELGDLLWSALLLMVMAEEEKGIKMRDAIAELKEKMVRRHPHVYGDMTAKDSTEVLEQWHEIKKKEKELKKKKITRDFVTATYVYQDGKTLFVHNKKLNKWIPPGGHLDVHELPDEGALREVKEETGLDVELIGSRKEFPAVGVTELVLPNFIQQERISPGHEHIDLVYFSKVVGGKLAMLQEELHDMKWFTLEEALGAKELQDDVKEHVKTLFALLK